MIKKVQERFALTHLGAVNLIKACVSCTISYLAIAMSIGVLYYFTCDVLEMLYGSSNTILYSMYLIEFVIVVILIFIAHYIQYNMTFYNTYKESARLPKDADANGAYCIALKGLYEVKQIKENWDKNQEFSREVLKIKHTDWFDFIQNKRYL